MSAPRRGSRSAVAAEDEADRIYHEMRPALVEMIERNDPAVAGLTFNDIEANSAAVGDLLAKLLMRRAIEKQPAATDGEIEEAKREAVKKADPNLAAGKKPGELRTKRMPGRERGVKTARGEIRYAREYVYFPDLKVGVFPLDRRLGLGEGDLTDRVERHLLEELARDDYRDSAKSIEVFGSRISAAKAGRVLVKAAGEIHRELYGPDAMIGAGKEAPKNPAELLIVEGDGSRYRTNEADKRKKGDTSKAAPTDCPSEAQSGASAACDGIAPEERARGWRENKVGVVIRGLPGHTDPDGEYVPPKELVKTYVATTEGIEEFGRDLRTEADRRGIEAAKDAVLVSDNGHGMPAMFEREFPRQYTTNRVTDFYHTTGRLSDCTKTIHGEGARDAPARARMYLEIRGLLRDGKAEGIIDKLTPHAEALAPRPKKLSELDSKPDAKELWTHVMYLEKYKDTMDYPTYRAKGWPVGSGSVEAACGQFGDRVKHARMRWTRKGADALHVAKAAILSGDGRWERRYPAPIPVLELPEALPAARAG